MKPGLPAILSPAWPVIVAGAAAMTYVAYVEWPGPYIALNLAPMLVAIVLALICLYRGDGRWSGSGFRWPLGTLGFALSAIGVSLYLHYGYANDRDEMVSEATTPMELFRYLPIYALFAGATGFAIGWIVGRNFR